MTLAATYYCCYVIENKLSHDRNYFLAILLLNFTLLDAFYDLFVFPFSLIRFA